MKTDVNPSSETKIVVCPVCQSASCSAALDYRYGVKSAFIAPSSKIFFCGACDFYFVFPQRFSVGEPFRRYFANFRSKNIYDIDYPRALGQLAYIGRFIDTLALKNVLEIGPGLGLLMDELKAVNPDLTLRLVEQDKTSLKQLRKRGYDCFEGLLTEKTKDQVGGDFDLILMSHVLHFIPNPLDILKLLRNMMSRTRESHIFIEVPNFLVLREMYAQFDSALSFFTPTSLKGILERAGFTVVDLQTSGRRRERSSKVRNDASWLDRVLFKRFGLLNCGSDVLRSRISSLEHFSYGGDRIWIRALAAVR